MWSSVAFWTLREIRLFWSETFGDSHFFFQIPVPIPRSAPPRPDLIRHEAQNKEFADERKMQVTLFISEILVKVAAVMLQDLQIQTEASTNRLQDVRRRDPNNPALFYDIWKFMRGWVCSSWCWWFKGNNTGRSPRRPLGFPFICSGLK